MQTTHKSWGPAKREDSPIVSCRQRAKGALWWMMNEDGVRRTDHQSQILLDAVGTTAFCQCHLKAIHYMLASRQQPKSLAEKVVGTVCCMHSKTSKYNNNKNIINIFMKEVCTFSQNISNKTDVHIFFTKKKILRNNSNKRPRSFIWMQQLTISTGLTTLNLNWRWRWSSSRCLKVFCFLPILLLQLLGWH